MRGTVAALALLLGCTTTVDPDDLDFDDLADDPLAEPDPVDDGTSETQVAAASGCKRVRFLHVANWSYVADLATCASGVCKNACWGSQRRTSGFACDYSSSQADRIATRDGGAAFASYNEIKPLNASDGTAVASCKAQSGHPLRTYVVWNGSGWNREGISATLHFAELYGTQSEAQPRFWTWYEGYRDTYSPMGNVSPETFISAEGVENMVKRMCATTRTGWLGLYFYDGNASGGAGMAEWKRAAIIRAMNYCTTH